MQIHDILVTLSIMEMQLLAFVSWIWLIFMFMVCTAGYIGICLYLEIKVKDEDTIGPVLKGPIFCPILSNN